MAATPLRRKQPPVLTGKKELSNKSDTYEIVKYDEVILFYVLFLLEGFAVFRLITQNCQRFRYARKVFTGGC